MFYATTIFNANIPIIKYVLRWLNLKKTRNLEHICYSNDNVYGAPTALLQLKRKSYHVSSDI